MRSAFKRAEYIKKKNIFGFMGENVVFQVMIIPLYPKLIKIHDNVTISTNVTFLTHDVIHRHINYRYGSGTSCENIQAIEILENCFIGSGAIINGNVRIGPNSIVGAGAVVTKDVPPDTIVAGVPAKKIASFDELLEKRRNNKEYSYESYEEVWSNFYLQRNSY